jgi:hypothetical protein
MLVAAAEFVCWSVFGLALGFAGHWWKSHADPHPDVLDEDRPLLNMALTEYSAENYLAERGLSGRGQRPAGPRSTERFPRSADPCPLGHSEG